MMNKVIFWICYIAFHTISEICSKIRNVVTLMIDTAMLCLPLKSETLMGLWRHYFEVKVRVCGLYVIDIE